MAYSYTERKRIRKNFGSRDSVLEIPYLLQMQKDAYIAFLQADVHPKKRTALLLATSIAATYPLPDISKGQAIRTARHDRPCEANSPDAD